MGGPASITVSVLPSDVQDAEVFTIRRPYATGRRCTCGRCQGEYLSYYIVEGKRGRTRQRESGESWCPDCGCRRQGGHFIPCHQYHSHPHTGIRRQAETPGAAGYLQLERVAIEKLADLFPGENPLGRRMTAVTTEPGLFFRLRALFPLASLDWLLATRRNLIPAACPACRQTLPWPEPAADPASGLLPPSTPKPRAQLRRHRGRWWADGRAPEHLSLF